MTEFATGASRDTGGKGRCDLLPHCALIRISRQMEDALEEHEERNWEKGMPMHCYLDSAMRHLFRYMDGDTDEDHLAAAGTNVLMALWTEEHLPDMQDIPSRRAPRAARGDGRLSEALDGGRWAFARACASEGLGDTSESLGDTR